MTKDLVTTYNDLISKITALRAEAKEVASAILHEGTKSYFEKHGTIVEQIFWQQYTPWFNDGETCVFSTGEPNIVLYADTNEEKYEYGSDFCNDMAHYKDMLDKWAEFNADPEAYKDKINANTGGNYFNNNWNKREHYKPYYLSKEELLAKVAQYNSYPKDFVKDTDAMLDVICSIDDAIMEELFGNHITVRITANGVETEEYNHE